MNIYNLFWYSKENVSLQERWVPFRDVRNAGPFAPAFESNILKPFAMTFEGKTEKLRRAAEKMGGQPVRQGDAGYIVHAFSCIPMQYLFWDGDEEFPAQGNILFDYSVTDFIHVESTVTLAEEGIIRLAELAGITCPPTDGISFLPTLLGKKGNKKNTLIYIGNILTQGLATKQSAWENGKESSRTSGKAIRKCSFIIWKRTSEKNTMWLRNIPIS